MEYMFGSGGGGRGGMMMGGNRRFETQYQCFSSAMAGRSNIDEGDKILLPPSALDTLARMNVEYPMLFELKNEALGKKTHCGVLEFSAEEGRCYMPFWMMQNMLMEEGQLIAVKNVSLAKATFVKFRAQNVDFLEISNHRAVLEVTLRKFTCLSEGDQICISHSGKLYYLDVREVKPNGAASIIETDCDVDFEEPVGYQDSHYAQYEKNAAAKHEQKTAPVEVARTLQKAREVTPDELAAKNGLFKAFGGDAKRIDGRQIAADKESSKEGKDSKDSKGSSSSSASASATASSKSTYSAKDNSAFADKVATTATVPPAYQSRIGDKFSKKKSALTALTDPGQKFAGAANKLN